MECSIGMTWTYIFRDLCVHLLTAHPFHLTQKRTQNLFSRFAGRNIARHRRAHGWLGRSVFTATSNCRLRASRWSHSPGRPHRIGRSIPSTKRDRVHSDVGRETNQVRPRHSNHIDTLLTLDFFARLPNRITQCDYKNYLKGIEENDIFVAGTLEEKASELQRKFELLLVDEKELNDKACKGESNVHVPFLATKGDLLYPKIVFNYEPSTKHGHANKCETITAHTLPALTLTSVQSTARYFPQNTNIAQYKMSKSLEKRIRLNVKCTYGKWKMKFNIHKIVGMSSAHADFHTRNGLAAQRPRWRLATIGFHRIPST